MFFFHIFLPIAFHTNRTHGAPDMDKAVNEREAICNSQRKNLDLNSKLHPIGKDIHQSEPDSKRERNCFSDENSTV